MSHSVILTVGSQGIPESLTMQQTSHKIFTGEQNRLAAASGQEERQQKAGWKGRLRRGFGACSVS